MIGVGDPLVRVGNLHHRQQGQQNQTHNGDRREGTRPASPLSASLESGQHHP
jgi:hypothetical protein